MFFFVILQSAKQGCVLLQIPNSSGNGAIHAERPAGHKDRDRSHMAIGESEQESLLTFENTPKFLRNKQLSKSSDQGKHY